MSVRITVPTTVDVARLIEALLFAADHAGAEGAPLLEREWRRLADRVGDGLDDMAPTVRGKVEDSRQHITRYLESDQVLCNGLLAPRATAMRDAS